MSRPSRPLARLRMKPCRPRPSGSRSRMKRCPSKRNRPSVEPSQIRPSRSSVMAVTRPLGKSPASATVTKAGGSRDASRSQSEGSAGGPVGAASAASGRMRGSGAGSTDGRFTEAESIRTAGRTKASSHRRPGARLSKRSPERVIAPMLRLPPRSRARPDLGTAPAGSKVKVWLRRRDRAARCCRRDPGRC